MRKVRVLQCAGPWAATLPDVEPKQVGVYDDSILSALDDLLYEAAAHGVKLTLAMHDRWSLGCWRHDVYIKVCRASASSPPPPPPPPVSPTAAVAHRRCRVASLVETHHQIASSIPHFIGRAHLVTRCVSLPQKYNLTVTTDCSKLANESTPWPFYRLPTAKADFKARLQHVLEYKSRRFPGRRLGDLHEAILSVEAENEAMGHMQLLALPPADPVLGWMCEMAGFLRPLVHPSILVSSGGGGVGSPEDDAVQVNGRSPALSRVAVAIQPMRAAVPRTARSGSDLSFFGLGPRASRWRRRWRAAQRSMSFACTAVRPRDGGTSSCPLRQGTSCTL